MVTDKNGNKFEYIEDANEWTDRRGNNYTIVNYDGEKRVKCNDFITTLTPDSECPMSGCNQDNITLDWEVPVVSYACGNCGYMGLCSREYNNL